MADKNIPIEDVDDIIAAAEELRQRDRNTLTFEDIEEVGRELDIDPAYVREAIEALPERRQREAAEAENARRRRLAMFATVGATIALVLALALSGRGRAAAGYAEVETARAAVASALERQAGVEARYEGLEATPDVRAERDGAANRVYVAMRRYDESVEAYNAGSGSLWRGLFGFPQQVYTSAEVDW